MRIGIIGAGAIGCVVGGLLTKAGHDVTLVDQWPEHIETMRSRGLRLSGTCGEHTIPVKALHIHELQGVTTPFEIYPDIFVPVGNYENSEAQLVAFTNQGAPLSVRMRLTVGGFFQDLFVPPEQVGPCILLNRTRDLLAREVPAGQQGT